MFPRIPASPAHAVKPAVRFGIGPQQKAALAQVQADNVEAIAHRDHVNALLRNWSLSGLAHEYARTDNDHKSLAALEEALIIRMREAQQAFKTAKTLESVLNVWPMEQALAALDSGRLEGKDLPEHVQAALLDTVSEFERMKARLGSK